MHGPDGSNYSNASVFRELEAGKKILWVQEFEDPKVAAAVRHIAEPGNEQNLDRLHMHFAW